MTRLLLFALIIIAAAWCAATISASPVRLLAWEHPALEPTEALYVYSLTEPGVEMPTKMAKGAGTVWLGCEIEGLSLTPYADLSAAVGAAGERGQAQIHPSWERNALTAMDFVRLGLDYNNEGDRIRFAVELWKRAGWGQWSCAKRMGVR